MGNVTIIGGGASGLTAAITAASAGARVTLIEQNDRVGKCNRKYEQDPGIFF